MRCLDSSPQEKCVAVKCVDGANQRKSKLNTGAESASAPVDGEPDPAEVLVNEIKGWSAIHCCRLLQPAARDKHFGTKDQAYVGPV